MVCVYARRARGCGPARRRARRSMARAPSRRSTCASTPPRSISPTRSSGPKSEGDRIQVSTAPGADGIIRRIEVRAREAGNNWAVFALANNSDEQIDRLIVVPHYRMVGLRPVLARPRPLAHRQHDAELRRPARSAGQSPSADIFRITLDPGTVITYVVELRSDKLPQLYLWEPDAYKDKINSFTLYHGIVIGIAGLLALFLTILFVVKGSVMFPGRRRARLGGARLYRHRLRILGQGVRPLGRRRARLARVGRGDPRRDAGGVPVRLSQPQPLARALRAHHGAAGSCSSARSPRSRCSIRRSPPASRACRSPSWRSRASASSSISRRTASTARCC